MLLVLRNKRQGEEEPQQKFRYEISARFDCSCFLFRLKKKSILFINERNFLGTFYCVVNSAKPGAAELDRYTLYNKFGRPF